MPVGKNKIRIVIDVNLWVSLAIGKQSAILSDVIVHPMIEVYADGELLGELKEVLQKPKLKKFISPARKKEALRLIKHSVFMVKPVTVVHASRDPSDDYLLALSFDCRADYLITGDKDLLELKSFKGTEIITLNVFIKRVWPSLF
jgi:putative PIN family toxin of toxin-antitoxin system